MKILITGARGLIGTALQRSFREKGHEMLLASRKEPANTNEIKWDAENGFAEPSRLEGVEIVVHLAGENVSGGLRWTDEKKRAIRDSRVAGTRSVVDAMAAMSVPPKVFIASSAIGFYGDRADEVLTESAAAGTTFLSDVSTAWEAESRRAEDAGIRTVLLRIGIVLAKDGGALAAMLTPFRLGVGGIVGSGKQWMSWVSLDDIVGIVNFAIEHENIRGAVNAVAPAPVRNEEFTKAMGDVLYRPTFLPLPAFAVNMIFGEMGNALLLASTRVLPKRLEEAGYPFAYTDIRRAIEHAVNQQFVFSGEPKRAQVHRTGAPMKNKKILFLTFAAVGAAAIVYFVPGKNNIYAQEGRLPRVVSTKSSKPVTVDAASFGAAAGQNAQLLDSLSWIFSGKVQTGWSIYVPLISQTIGASSPPDSAPFASDLSKWQAVRGLAPSGVLDRDTMDAFVQYWQSRRLGKSAPAAAERLRTAPISEFYDQSRDASLLQLDADAYGAYKRMLAAASIDLKANAGFAATEKFLRIISSYRSPEYQAELRRKEPNAGRGALARFSAHFTGQALDLYVGGEPVSTRDPNRALQVQTSAYKWLVKNASRFGFFPYFYEPWHWEYVPGR